MNPYKSNFPQLAVLGAGAWGSALAIHLAKGDQEIRLWDYNQEQIKQIQQTRTNPNYLPNCHFPTNIHAFAELAEAMQDIQGVLLVVPSHGFRNALQSIKPYVTSSTRIAWATKGIDPTSNLLFHQVVEENLGPCAMAVLSGPSFALELAKGLPTAVTVASNEEKFAEQLATRFSHSNMRAYVSNDLVGVQLGGAIKNVLAIAVGIADGLGFGANARCALITRGLAEMVRLGIHMGANEKTFRGLSGVGDLILTCTDNQSRNRRFGLAIGEGKTIEAAKETVGKVVEGYQTVSQVVKLAEQYQIDMPITAQVWQILFNNLPPKQAVSNLLLRAAKAEFE